MTYTHQALGLLGVLSLFMRRRAHKSLIAPCAVVSLWLILTMPVTAWAQSTQSTQSTQPAQPAQTLQARGGSSAAENRLIARLIPVRRALVSGEIAGVIRSVVGDAGVAFKKGDNLIFFNCSIQSLSRDLAKIDVRIAQTKWDAQRDLTAHNAGNPVELSLAELAHERSVEQARLAQAHVSQCYVNAPFDGVVARRLRQTGDYAQVGETVLEIVSSETPRVEMIVPSSYVNRLRKGGKVDMIINELPGTTVSTTIITIGPLIDPESQTILVTAALESPPPGLIIGMSGVINLDRLNTSE